MTRRRWAALAAGLLLASPLEAQQDSTLHIAVQLASEGRGDSARALVRARLATLTPTDSLFPEALYTAGVVAQDHDSAIAYLRRVAIEYARSPWAERALLRTSQLAFAAGNPGATLRAARRLLTDYPLTALAAQASFWAAHAEFQLGNLPEGCRLLLRAQEKAGEDVELANRARYLYRRCESLPSPTDSTAADPGAPPPTGVAGPTVYSVQLAAVGTAASADEIMQTLYAAGYEPHVVRDADGLFKIRVGRYADRREAQRLASELERKLGGNPFVVEER